MSKYKIIILVFLAIFVVISILYFDKFFNFYSDFTNTNRWSDAKSNNEKTSVKQNTAIAIKPTLKKFLPAEDQIKFVDSPYWNQIIEKQKEISPDDQGLTARIRAVKVLKVLIPNQKYEVTLSTGEKKVFLISDDTILYVPKFKYDEKDTLLGFSREVVKDKTILYTISPDSQILVEVDDANMYTSDKDITLKSILFAD